MPHELKRYVDKHPMQKQIANPLSVLRSAITLHSAKGDIRQSMIMGINMTEQHEFQKSLDENVVFQDAHPQKDYILQDLLGSGAYGKVYKV